MEYLVLQSYLEFKGKNKRKVKDIIEEIGKVGIGAVIALIVSGIIGVINALNNNYIIVYIGIFFEILSDVVILEIVEERDRENSKLNIKKKDEEYAQIVKWLKEIKYTRKEQIKQLCYRCELVIEKNKKKEKEERKRVEKFMFAFAIPMVLHILKWMLEMKGNASMKLALVIVIMLLVMAAYFFILGIAGALHIIFSRRQQGMENMVEDLHGILDRCFPVEEKDLIK